MKKRACVVLLVFAAACAQRSAADVLAAAPAAAKSKGSAAMSLVAAMKISTQGQSFTTRSTVDGVMDLVKRRGKMRMLVFGLPGVVTDPCDLISDGNVAYVGIDPPRRTNGKAWTKIDVSKVSGIDVNSLSSDPTSALDYLKSASKDVTTVGQETVRGTETTHYHFTASIDQLLSKFSGESRTRLKAIYDSIGMSTLPIDAWVDKDGLPRRVQTVLKGSKSGASFEATTTVEMFDYGKPVNVAIPPESQVRTLATPTLAFTDCMGIGPGGR